MIDYTFAVKKRLEDVNGDSVSIALGLGNVIDHFRCHHRQALSRQLGVVQKFLHPLDAFSVFSRLELENKFI